ncbi:uncharacterized protein LOC129629324 isoform X3 [Bubalus kerabau]|uniref:uncharacterized protein LOC129629324 isoform X3 n=1 Tax=Bubalus carabanensis TaxID=3119969 RepID=UPI00244EB58A|nr:uncharacterized protein LOC129629324 isoform X3 [Bubalus carabanensis]
MWNLPGPGIKLVSPGLAARLSTTVSPGGFFTAEPPGKTPDRDAAFILSPAAAQSEKKATDSEGSSFKYMEKSQACPFFYHWLRFHRCCFFLTRVCSGRMSPRARTGLEKMRCSGFQPPEGHIMFEVCLGFSSPQMPGLR